jgi:uncharacterized membrane protein YhaH (DUF805 family)
MLILSALAFLGDGNDPDFFFALFGIYFFLTFIPFIAVTVRRFHDIGKNGWTILMAFIPFVGGILLLVFTCLDSEPNDNKYGQNPKSITSFDDYHSS